MWPHSLEVRYVPDKETKPKIGRLFVFSNVDDALDIVKCNGHEIWLCEATAVRAYRSEVLCTKKLQPDFIARFWKHNIKGNMRVPEGTRTAGSIKLIEKKYFGKNWRWHRAY